MASVRHRGGDMWHVSISLGQRTASGGYARTFRTIRARNKTEAKRYAQEIEVELRGRSATLAAERATFLELVEAWFKEWLLVPRSPTTRRSYRQVIDLRVKTSPLADRRVREIRPGHIDSWYLQLTQGHASQAGAAKPGLSPSTIRKLHAIVRQAFDHAVRNGWLISNPADTARLPSGAPPEVKRVTVDEVRAVLFAAGKRHPARGRALLFAARTGLRRGEVAGMAWSRVSTTDLLMLVELNIVRAGTVSGGDALVVKEPKGRKALPIPIDEETAGAVLAQQEWQIEASRVVGTPIARDPWLWSVTPPFSRPLSPDTLTHWMAEACRDAGVRGVRLHDLRHFTGSQLGDAVRAVAGASREDVRRMLRHAQASTTDRYLHAEEDHAVRRRLLEHLPSLEQGAAE